MILMSILVLHGTTLVSSSCMFRTESLSQTRKATYKLPESTLATAKIALATRVIVALLPSVMHQVLEWLGFSTQAL